jgi:hypothetical protein
MNKLSLAAMLALATCAPVHAQNQCAMAEDVYLTLQGEYQESRIGAGLSGPGVIEFWVNSETGTFTVVGVLPSGVACLITSGDAFEFYEDNYRPRPNL